MIDNLLGGNDDSEPETNSIDDDMSGGLFDQSEGSGGPIEGDDELMDGGDDLMGGDDMGFDDMDNGEGATSAEMDNRIDELENEVASLSSTVNTVKSENEQISGSVEDVEENIRKLLEVYEMVTRGVNPFVDETEMGDAFGGGGGNSGAGGMSLFGDDEAEGNDTNVDESIADADAEDFFDDDLDDGADFDDDLDDGADFDDDLDDGADFDDDVSGGGGDFDDDLGDGGAGFDEFDDGGGFDDDVADGGGDFDDGLENGDTNGGGKSFEELKAEYDSGEADWDDANSKDGEDDQFDADTEEDDQFDADTEEDDDSIADHDTDTADSDIEAFESDDGVDDVDSPTDEAGSETEATDADIPAPDSGSNDPVESGKPYLATLPSGYVADIVVMDWLEFLVSESGVDGAARTIAYYEAIEWIGEDAAETLQTFLDGFGERTEDEPEPRSSLTVSHHNTSLRFISRISNPDMEMVAFDERIDSIPDSREETVSRNSTVALGDPSGVRSNDTSRTTVGMESDGGRDLTFDASCFEWGDDRPN